MSLIFQRLNERNGMKCCRHKKKETAMKHVGYRRGFAVSSFLLSEIDFCESDAGVGVTGEEWQVGNQIVKER